MKVKAGDILTTNPPDDSRYLMVSVSDTKLAGVYLHDTGGRFPPLYVDRSWDIESCDARNYIIIGNIFDNE